MNPICIACIVEGYGDVEAVPITVRRIALAVAPDVTLQIAHPAIRVARNKIVQPQQLESAVELAARKLDGPGGILVLMDADEDCPAQLGTDLLKRAVAARSDYPVAVVIAKPEFEAWFASAAVSLRGSQGLAPDLVPPQHPEGLSDAKGWLRRNMLGSRKYSETVDQAVFARRFDLHEAKACGSFDKLCRDIEMLISRLRA
ncbi:MAG TPA: DUF4276 family protein [Chthonomonadaceae bacterium]|nr:DUF4276 family protein [Chthonomonadaceae bacterium]